MSFQQFGELLKYIDANNSPIKNFTHGRRTVKYLDPVIDMRTNSVFAVTLRGFGYEDMVFHTQNECRDLPQSLFERIKEFLDTPMR